MPDAGDAATVTLVVDPYDGTTAATLTVRAPDGTTSSPATSTADGGHTWTAQVTYTAAGVWLLKWTVTGTGAGVTNEQVAVAPTPGDGLTGRVYATTTQLANFLQEAPPLNAAKLLWRASRLLDSDFLKAAVYDVDVDGMPTDPEVAEAFADAVCAQVEFWEEVGEETDISGPLQGVTIGSVNLQYGAGDNRSGPSYYAPKLVRALVGLPADKFRMMIVTGC
ncbi:MULTISPECIES: hypothetical protein [unclassified Streptomyces]|uniref:hypothetical protein n=1 Tax=unclassified Streptomyces TaxID=2593676 RepID=UPI001489C9FE|nr:MULTISPECIES: hypothetical protein [unclassified Streptomyces]